MSALTLTHIGGPTLLLEIDGARFLTDPTFSPPGSYASGAISLEKLRGPALSADEIGAVDAVLLSHDQHADNLDPAGRSFLARAPHTLSTPAAAARIDGVVGCEPWQSYDLAGVRITATPARHGPAGSEPIVGDVAGFLIARAGEDLVYLTGDTVFYDGIIDVARRAKPKLVVVFAGAAQTRGPFHLTMNTNDVLETARWFPDAHIAVIHSEGWAHFTQSFDDVRRAFAVLGREERLIGLEAGVPRTLTL